MEKSLQQQYNLIKEGKGDKQFFLKSARYQFPDYITSLTDFNTLEPKNKIPKPPPPGVAVFAKLSMAFCIS